MKYFIFGLTKFILEYLCNLEFYVIPFNRKSRFFTDIYLRLMKVDFQMPIHFGHHVEIRHPGNFSIGKCCCIGSNSRIWNYAPIVIGDDFLSAGDFIVNSGMHDPLTLKPGSFGNDIRIGSRVWCGVNVTVVAGVTIGDDVVIGAGSVVVKDLPSNCVAAGVPARKIRDLNRIDVELWRPFDW